MRNDWTSIVYHCVIGSNMGIEVVFKIAGIGLIVSILNQVLKSAGKDEIATLTTLAGIVVVLLIVVELINELFFNIQNLFGLY